MKTITIESYKHFCEAYLWCQETLGPPGLKEFGRKWYQIWPATYNKIRFNYDEDYVLFMLSIGADLPVITS